MQRLISLVLAAGFCLPALAQTAPAPPRGRNLGRGPARRHTRFARDRDRGHRVRHPKARHNRGRGARGERCGRGGRDWDRRLSRPRPKESRGAIRGAAVGLRRGPDHGSEFQHDGGAALRAGRTSRRAAPFRRIGPANPQATGTVGDRRSPPKASARRAPRACDGRRRAAPAVLRMTEDELRNAPEFGRGGYFVPPSNFSGQPSWRPVFDVMPAARTAMFTWNLS
jgi:hypothetical protein